MRAIIADDEAYREYLHLRRAGVSRADAYRMVFRAGGLPKPCRLFETRGKDAQKMLICGQMHGACLTFCQVYGIDTDSDEWVAQA